jgi:hypothetical protein
MKRKGLKGASYPFDWIVSRPNLVVKCLDDNFRAFLDRSAVNNKRNPTLPGLLYYHLKGSTFTDAEHSYYQRCVKRFLELPPGTLFVICTLDDCAQLSQTLQKRFKDSHLLVFRQHRVWDRALHSKREWNRISAHITEYKSYIWHQQFSWDQHELWFLWEVVMWEIRKCYKSSTLNKAEHPILDIEWMK